MSDGNDINLDFIGIGVPKAATSWLYFCLKEHPEICTPEKEIDFFNATTPFPEESEGNYKQGLSWYASYFNRCQEERVVGEFSVNYFADPEAPKRIEKHFPDVKLILILRNPVDRAYSHYQYRRAKKRSSGPSKRAQEMEFILFLESEKEFRQIGFYDKHLTQWLSYFDKDQLLIWFYEDIENKPEKVVKETYKSLSVKTGFKPNALQKRINTTKEKRRRSLGNPFTSFITQTGYSLYDLFSAEDRGYPALDPEMRRRITEMYRPHIAKTAEILEKDLHRWLSLES